MISLSGFCADPLLVVKFGEGSDGDWFPAGAGGGTNTSCTDVVEFLGLVLVACNGTSASDIFAKAANTGGVVASIGGRGDFFAVMSTGPFTLLS